MARAKLSRLTGNGNGERGKDDCPNEINGTSASTTSDSVHARSAVARDRHTEDVRRGEHAAHGSRRPDAFLAGSVSSALYAAS